MKILAPLAAALAIPLAACATVPSSADVVTVSGEATYRERIALPPQAVMSVRIEDVSRADSPATVLAEEIMPTNGRQVPLPFSVEVPRDALQGAVRTTARVRIEDGSGQLLWITDTNTPGHADGGQRPRGSRQPDACAHARLIRKHFPTHPVLWLILPNDR